MTSTSPARTTPRRTARIEVAALVVAGAALIGVLGYRSLALWWSPAPSTATGAPSTQPGHESLPGAHDGAAGEADGVVPGGVTVFDDDYPAVANLNPGLLDALRRAATAAADDGVAFVVDSGWRSPAYQEQLLQEAIKEYGSEEEADRWVATPTTSAHVTGDAIDLGADAAAWLAKHGARYALCQVYRNEPWHYELRPGATDDGCPPMYADATQDPRMRR